MRRLGLLGGTFDPIHLAHLRLASAAKQEFSLDALWLIPAGHPYLDKHQDVTDREDRFRMAELAAEDIPGVSVSEIERENRGNTYTADTLERLSRQNPADEFYFIVGTDQFFRLRFWYRPDLVLRYAHIVVAERLDDKNQADFMGEKRFLETQFQARIHSLHFPRMDISSTEIRERVRRGEPIAHMVPKKVEEYILKHRLYQ